MLNKAFAAAGTAGLVLLGGAAQAHTQSISATVTNLQTYGNGDVWSMLGSDPVDTISLSFRWNGEADPFSTGSVSNSSWEYAHATHPYDNFEVNVGSVTLTGAPSLNAAERIHVRDGIADLSGNTSDYFDVSSYSNQQLATGATFDYMRLVGWNIDESVIDGTEVPTVSELAALSATDYLEIYLRDPNAGGFAILYGYDIEYTVTPIPLPGSLSLLAAAFGALLVGRRVRGRAA